MRHIRYFFEDYSKPLITFLVALPFLLVFTLAIAGVTITPIQPLPNISTVTSTTQPTYTDTTPATSLVSSALRAARSYPGYTAQASSPTPINPAGEACLTNDSSAPIATPLIPMITRSVSLTHGTLGASLTVQVYGAGLGALALANEMSILQSCSVAYVQGTTNPPFTGYIVVYDTASTNTTEYLVRQGDVLLVVVASAPATNAPLGLTPTARALSLLQSVTKDTSPIIQKSCIDENAPVIASTHNPTQPNYKPLTVTTVIYPPASLSPPDPGLIHAPTTTLPTPAPGSITFLPVAPTEPTYPTSVVSQVPTTDPTGPGCGWSFTGSLVPPVKTNPNTSVALAPLVAAWKAWPATAKNYRAALATYDADTKSYEQWLLAATTTTTLPPTTTTSTLPPTTTTLPTTTTSSTTTTLLPTTSSTG